MINQHSAELQRYAHLLDGAGAEVEERAGLATRIWNQAFPTLPLASVEREMDAWLSRGQYLTRRIALKATSWPAAERRLGDADVYAVRALLGALAKRDAGARSDVAAALAAEPTNVLARLLAAGIDHTEIAVADARALAAAHADDWRAWLLVAAAVRGADDKAGEAAAARAKACELAAANPALLPPAKLCPTRHSDEP